MEDMTAAKCICFSKRSLLNSSIHFGELSNDEYFVTESASKDGAVFRNLPITEPLVILYHFADKPQAVRFHNTDYRRCTYAE